jgi:hypothetical protein
MPADVLLLTGQLAKVKPEDARRLAVYLARGGEILAHQPLDPSGAVQLPLARRTADAESAYPLELVVGPAGMRARLGDAPNLQRVVIDPARARSAKEELELPLNKLKLGEAILEPWWRWCRYYCVSGQVIGSNGCPVPYAEVIVNSVDFALTKNAVATTTTDVNGNFTACFNWCGDVCWPCWPFWWRCWPWWWEWDILHVIENIEENVPRIPGPGPVETLRAGVSVAKPDVAALARGAGFGAARGGEERFAPDEARTSLIRRKLSSPAIQRLFPWWWWCCENPNVCFTVIQDGTVVLDENPASETRWCLPDESNETLVVSEPAFTVCPGEEKPLVGFLWQRVADTTVDLIEEGYADGATGSADSDLAFWNTLDIYGEFAAGSKVSYYQVMADQWTGDPARGGTALGAPASIDAPLYNQVAIWHKATKTVTFHTVKMGPFNHGGHSNLYFTQEERASNVEGSPPEVPPFPPYEAGDEILWSFDGRKVYTDASQLVDGGVNGGVTLTVLGYTAKYGSVALEANPDESLTLLIDNTAAVTTAHINKLQAFTAKGEEVTSEDIGECPGFDIGPGGYIVLNVTVNDTNEHIASYLIEPDYGHGLVGPETEPGERNYQPPATFPPLPYEAPDTAVKAFGGGTENIMFHPTADCCYDFRLVVAKRVTNGSVSPGFYTADFWTAMIRVSVTS